MKTRDRKPFFERLKKGLNEGIAHSKGELTLRTVAIPDPPPEIDAATLASVRAQTAMSQRLFARMLNVSPKRFKAGNKAFANLPTHPEDYCRSSVRNLRFSAESLASR